MESMTFEFRPLGRPLSDGLITLRDRTAADVAVLVANRDEVSARFLGPEHPDPDPLACIEVDGETIGWVDYDVGRAWLTDGEVNIGYGVFPRHRGRGYARRAVRLLASHLDERPGFVAATLLIDPDNGPSLGVATHLGFAERGVVEGERFFYRPARLPYSAERSYYEEEAARELRRAPSGRRVELRQRFIELLESEGRTSVLDFGAGPAGDGPAFAGAGIDYVGLDLAHGNGLLAAAAGLRNVCGSIDAPPFMAASFDAGWSMSTLMHVPESLVSATVSAMVGPLGPGAPLLIGQWGGTSHSRIDEGLDGRRRRFRHDPLDRNVGHVAHAVEIIETEVWDVPYSDGDYQIIWGRVR